MYTKNTKIVCTLGPQSKTVETISKMIEAGMNVARLNFSHGTHKKHLELIKNIQKAEKKTSKTIGIMQDLQGQKIRLGEIEKSKLKLEKNDKITITTKKIIGKKEKDRFIIPINYKDLTKDVKKDEKILLNDGLVEIQVIKINKTDIEGKVNFGGPIGTRNGVHFPTSNISAKSLTTKDKNDLKFGLKHNVDFIALSFVKNKKDIQELKKLINKQKTKPKIIAKIERHEAVKNLKEILKEADGLMVARGDLGTDIPAEKVPIIQKRMIALANKAGKPVITATQVLQSMVKSSRATRAEISDAANAIFDGTDAIMLSNETAVGKYPIKATKTLTKVSSVIEKEIKKHQDEIYLHYRSHNFTNATLQNAYELSNDTSAKFIIVYTKDGFTARNIAKFRPYKSTIITITENKKTAQQLTVTWGINTTIIKKLNRKKDLNNQIIKHLKKLSILKNNDKIIIVCNASNKESSIYTTKI